MSQEDTMEQQKYLRIIEKRGKSYIVDMDGNPLQPHEAHKVGNALVETAMGKSYVYIGKREIDGAYKIGRTEDIDRRQRELGITFETVFECDLYGDHSSVKLEAAFHKFFEEDRLDGEWFKLSASDLYFVHRVKDVSNRISFLHNCGVACEKILDGLENKNEREYWLIHAGLLITNHIPFISEKGCMIYYLLWKRYEGLVALDDLQGANYILGIVSLVRTLFTTDFKQIKEGLA